MNATFVFHTGAYSVKTDLFTGRAVSRLYIANANRHDSGNYSCALGDVAKAVVLVHVLNGTYCSHSNTQSAALKFRILYRCRAYVRVCVYASNMILALVIEFRCALPKRGHRRRLSSYRLLLFAVRMHNSRTSEKCRCYTREVVYILYRRRVISEPTIVRTCCCGCGAMTM